MQAVYCNYLIASNVLSSFFFTGVFGVAYIFIFMT